MIRPATPADADAIRAIAEAAYAPFTPLIGKRPAPLQVDYPAQIAEGIVYVHLSDEGVVDGFVVTYPRGDHMMLENVAVDPAAQGSGAGSALLAFCEDEARRRGLAAVELYTNAKMTANLGYYARRGYGETRRGMEEGFDRVQFRKELG